MLIKDEKQIHGMGLFSTAIGIWFPFWPTEYGFDTSEDQLARKNVSVLSHGQQSFIQLQVAMNWI